MTGYTAKVGCAGFAAATGGGVVTPIEAAHRSAVRDTIPMQASLLIGNLGSTLVAYMTGVRSRQMPLRWAAGNATPRTDAAARLLTAYTVWLAIVHHDGRDVARNWFIGVNPWLGDISPAEAIRNGDKRVLAAAQAFIEDAGGA